MGWNGGAEIFIDIWKDIREIIPVDKRVDVCVSIIKALEKADWENSDEPLRDEWPEYRKALDIVIAEWEAKWEAENEY